MDIIDQACCTNSGGWNIVARQGKINHDLEGELQKHESLPDKVRLDDGSDLCVYETIGKESCVFVIRTQYGLFDNRQRSNMFSHGYSVDISNNGFDPNDFLTIDDTNFTDNIEVASKPRVSFSRIPKFDISTAIPMAGMTPDICSLLLKCVYHVAFRSNVEKVLRIVCSDQNKIKEILYCIYLGLPSVFASVISSSSCEYNLSDTRNIVFVKEKPTSGAKYFIPETGENNVLIDNIRGVVDQLHFIDYSIRCCSYKEERIREYYQCLLENAQLLAGAAELRTRSGAAFMEIANCMVDSTDPKDIHPDKELKRIIDLIENTDKNVKKILDIKEVGQYYSGLIREARSRSLLAAEQPRPAQYQHPQTPGAELVDADGFVRMGNLNQGKPDAFQVSAAGVDYSYMSVSAHPDQRQSSVVFSDNTAVFADLDRRYHEAVRQHRPEAVWEVLNAAADAIKNYCRGSDIAEKQRQVWMDNAKDFVSLRYDNGARDFASTLDNFHRVLIRLDVNDAEIQNAIEAQKESFWSNFSWDGFRIFEDDNYYLKLKMTGRLVTNEKPFNLWFLGRFVSELSGISLKDDIMTLFSNVNLICYSYPYCYREFDNIRKALDRELRLIDDYTENKYWLKAAILLAKDDFISLKEYKTDLNADFESDDTRGVENTVDNLTKDYKIPSLSRPIVCEVIFEFFRLKKHKMQRKWQEALEIYENGN